LLMQSIACSKHSVQFEAYVAAINKKSLNCVPADMR